MFKLKKKKSSSVDHINNHCSVFCLVIGCELSLDLHDLENEFMVVSEDDGTRNSS